MDENRNEGGQKYRSVIILRSQIHCGETMSAYSEEKCVYVVCWRRVIRLIRTGHHACGFVNTYLALNSPTALSITATVAQR